jgi:hypothetical protein
MDGWLVSLAMFSDREDLAESFALKNNKDGHKHDQFKPNVDTTTARSFQSGKKD